MARIAIRVRPGSREDALRWDPWRSLWVVSCRAPPVAGAANRSVAGLLAGWLSVPVGEVRWSRAGRSPEKVLDVAGITDEEARERLVRHAAPAVPGGTQGPGTAVARASDGEPEAQILRSGTRSRPRRTS